VSYISQYGRHQLDAEDKDAVLRVLDSDFLTQGHTVREFESGICEAVGSKYAIACANGTAALHLVMLGLGIKESDLVWTTPITFVASANAARYVGATIDLVDINARTWNLCPLKLEEKLEKTKNQGGQLPAAVILVHFAGSPADTRKIKQLSEAYGFRIVEDASHALGAHTTTENIGECKYSDACTFSFHPVKNITTGEGGAITTNSEQLWRNLSILRTHGIEKPTQAESRLLEEPWLYKQTQLGLNYRMCDIQAALGLSQIRKLGKFTKTRTSLAEEYRRQLTQNSSITFQDLSNNSSAHHLMVIRVPEDMRLSLFKHLKANEIGVQVHYIPIYRHPFYETQFSRNDFPNSELYYSQALSLPLHCNLTKPEVGKISQIVQEHLKRCVIQ